MEEKDKDYMYFHSQKDSYQKVETSKKKIRQTDKNRERERERENEIRGESEHKRLAKI